MSSRPSRRRRRAARPSTRSYPWLGRWSPSSTSTIRIAAAASLAKQAARLNGKLEDPRAMQGPRRGRRRRRPGTQPDGRSTPSGFFGGPASASRILRDRIRSDEDRFVRYNAAVALVRRGDIAAEATLREMLSSSDLDKVIEIPSATEKQNKIEAIQLEALEALRTAIRNGSPQLAKSLRPNSRSSPNRDWSASGARPSRLCKVYKGSPERCADGV